MAKINIDFELKNGETQITVGVAYDGAEEVLVALVEAVTQAISPVASEIDSEEPESEEEEEDSGEWECRVCGCTNAQGCDVGNGIACTWSEKDLCSECVGVEEAEGEEPEEEIEMPQKPELKSHKEEPKLPAGYLDRTAVCKLIGCKYGSLDYYMTTKAFPRPELEKIEGKKLWKEEKVKDWMFSGQPTEKEKAQNLEAWKKPENKLEHGDDFDDNLPPTEEELEEVGL